MELAVWTLALFKVLPNQDEVHWGWCLKRAILCFFPTLYSFLAARYFSGCSNFCTAQAVGSDPFDIQAGHGIFLAPEISVKILCPELPWNFHGTFPKNLRRCHLNTTLRFYMDHQAFAGIFFSTQACEATLRYTLSKVEQQKNPGKMMGLEGSSLFLLGFGTFFRG